MLRFDSEQKCHDYLVQVRWNGIPVCPHCQNNKMNYYLKSRKTYKCSICYKQFSVTRGTIFERSKLPLTQWMLAIYLIAANKKGMSSCEVARKLGIGQKTAWYLLQKLRHALKEENNIILSGVIEADETYVAPKIDRDLRLKMKKKEHDIEQNKIHGFTESKKRRLRGAPAKQGRKKGSTKEVLAEKKAEQKAKGKRVSFEKPIVVFGMIERGGRTIMKKIGNSDESVTKQNIYPILFYQATRDSILITDELNLYNDTHHIFKKHLTINHKNKKYVDGIKHTANIDNAWKHLKSMIRHVYHHVSYHHFDRYLNENVYRYNRRGKSLEDLFENFIPNALDKTTSYKKLTERGLNKIAA